MMSYSSLFKGLALTAVAAALLLTFGTSTTVLAKKSPTTQDAVGSWFGIARPCPANPATDSTDHAAFCTAICGLCPNAGVLPPEIPMLPTLLADGTITEDDAGAIGLFHTPAHGVWTLSEADGLADRPGTQRLKATFLWLGQTPPAFGVLGNAVRARFVTIPIQRTLTA